MKIALVYNGITHDMLLQGPLDRTAEFDGPSTVAALYEALAVHEKMATDLWTRALKGPQAVALMRDQLARTR